MSQGDNTYECDYNGLPRALPRVAWHIACIVFSAEVFFRRNEFRVGAVYSKTETQLAFFATVRMLLPPLVSTAVLVALTQLLGVRFTDSYVALALVSALLVWIAIGRDQRPQLVSTSGPLSVVGKTVVEWGAVVGTLLLIAYATKTSASFSRRALLLWFTITPLVIVAALTIVNAWGRAVAASPRNARRAVIVGSSYMSARLVQTVKNRPELGLHIERAFELQHDARDAKALISARQSVHDYVNQFRIDVVFLALPIEADSTRELLDSLRDTTSSIYLIPNIALQDLIQARSDEIDGVPVIALCESPLHGSHAFAKRATDIVFGSLLLLCALPVMLAIAAAIKLTSPGPVIFKQRRYGLDGEQFAVHKFRTMTVTENDGRIVQATRNDPRVTPLGPVSAPHVARRAAAATERGVGNDEPGRSQTPRRRAQRGVPEADQRLHGPSQSDAGNNRARAGQWLSRRNGHARRHEAACRVRPRIHAALELVAGPEDPRENSRITLSG